VAWQAADDGRGLHVGLATVQRLRTLHQDAHAARRDTGARIIA
jgi:hypothetical protein